jgi:ketosteroid isomerase-like protein
MSADNVKVVHQIYAAFGKGDVAGIVEHCAEDTDWTYNVSGSDVPWHRPFRGRSAIPQFFGALMEGADITHFVPTAFLAGGDDVAVRLEIGYTVRKTGKVVKMNQIHYWTFNDRRQVKALVHFEDTHAVITACR